MKVLLGVTGSISAYKTYDIARALVKSGHNVKVILTKGALEFIQPNTFTYLGVESVYTPTDDFSPERTGSSILHIDLARWADKLVLCPLSANTMAKLAHGYANDLLSSVFLAFGTKPILMFPAMNTLMFDNLITQRNIKILNDIDHIYIIEPDEGILACKEEGKGKLPQVEVCVDLIETIGSKKEKHVLITTGATLAPIDPVRYITNPSSGDTGYLIAKNYLCRGYSVTVVAGRYATKQLEQLTKNDRYNLIRVTTTDEMAKVVEENFSKCDLYISSAAICDIEFDMNQEKIKKNKLSGVFEFKSAQDILKTVLTNRKDNQKVVGFAAETNTSDDIFLEKWNRKPVDLLIGNKVQLGRNIIDQKGFQTEFGEYTFIQNGKLSKSKTLSKSELAEYLVSWSENDQDI